MKHGLVVGVAVSMAIAAFAPPFAAASDEGGQGGERCKDDYCCPDLTEFNPFYHDPKCLLPYALRELLQHWLPGCLRVLDIVTICVS